MTDYQQYHIDLMIKILRHVHKCLEEGHYSDAWEWYSVYCTAWNRIGKELPISESLKLYVLDTQKAVQDAKRDRESNETLDCRSPSLENKMF